MRDPLPADPVTPVNPRAIALLERKLAEAKAGKLTAVAVVGGSQGAISVDTDGDAGLLLIGAVQLQHQLRRMLFPDAAQMPTPPFGTRLSS